MTPTVPVRWSALRLSVALLVAGLAACGGKPDPLIGKWQQIDVEHGWMVEFAADGRMLVHGDGPDHSSHDHCNGTWQRQGDSLQLTGNWSHARVDVAWTATLADGVLQIAADPAAPRRFRQR